MPQVQGSDEQIGSQFYSSRIINNYLEYVNRYHPDLDLYTILRDADLTRSEVEDPAHWLGQDQVDRFHKILTEKTGDRGISHKVGRFSASSKTSGTLRQYALGLMSPSSAYWAAEKLSSKKYLSERWVQKI